MALPQRLVPAVRAAWARAPGLSHLASPLAGPQGRAAEPGAASFAPPPGRGKPLDRPAFIAWAQALDYALRRAAERFDGLPQRVFAFLRELRERLEPDPTGDLHLDEGLESLVVVSSIHREDRDARRFAPETTQ